MLLCRIYLAAHHFAWHPRFTSFTKLSTWPLQNNRTKSSLFSMPLYNKLPYITWTFCILTHCRFEMKLWLECPQHFNKTINISCILPNCNSKLQRKTWSRKWGAKISTRLLRLHLPAVQEVQALRLFQWAQDYPKKKQEKTKKALCLRYVHYFLVVKPRHSVQSSLCYLLIPVTSFLTTVLGYVAPEQCV